MERVEVDGPRRSSLAAGRLGWLAAGVLIGLPLGAWIWSPARHTAAISSRLPVDSQPEPTASGDGRGNLLGTAGEVSSAREAALPAAERAEPQVAVAAPPERDFTKHYDLATFAGWSREAIVAELRGEARAEAPRWQRIQDGLGSLIQAGDQASLQAVLDLLVDARFEFTGRAESFSRVLEGVDDPRFADVALEVLNRNLELGLNTWVDVQGYLEIIGRRGDRWASQVLLEKLLCGDGQLATTAAWSVADLKDHSQTLEYLELAKARPDVAGGVLNALASWGDASVNAELARMIDASEVDAQVAKHTAKALAVQVGESDVRALVARYWDCDPTRKAAYLAAALACGYRRDLPQEMRRETIGPILVDALDGGSETAREALYFFTNCDRLVTPEWIQAIEARLPGYGGELAEIGHGAVSTMKRELERRR